MKFMIFISLILLFAPFQVEARVPAGLLEGCSEANQRRCENFWNRQSAEQKKFLLSWPVEDRTHALTCLALYGYSEPTASMSACTRDLIGGQRSMAHCEQRGHKMMSVEMEKCQHAYRRKHNYPLPY